MNTQVFLGVPFAVGVPTDVAQAILSALDAAGLGAVNGPQGAGNLLVMVAQPVQVNLPDQVLSSLQLAINTTTGQQGKLGSANPIPWPTTGAPAGVTVTNDGNYVFVGSEPAYANMCLAYVQDRLGLPHEYPSAIVAWQGYSGLGLSTPTPTTGDMVFFSPAPINGGYGHVGIMDANGTFESVWSNGNVMDAPVGRFAADNAAPVLGYISVARLRAQIGQ